MFHLLQDVAEEAATEPTGDVAKELANMDVMTLKDRAIEWLSTDGVDVGIKLLIGLAIFVIGRWFAKLVTGLLGKAMRKAKFEDTVVSFLCNFVYMILLTVVALAALAKIGVETTSFAAVLAAAGFAVGMALQGSLGNFASGVMLVVFRPFKAGDVVTIAGETGKVVSVQIFNTVLLKPDNIKIIVPNGQVTGGTIVNLSAMDTRRVDLVIGIGYGDAIPKAKDILLRLVAEDDRILEEPAPQVAVAELGSSSVDFVVRPWVNTSDYWDVKFDLTEKIKLTFDEEGVSFPFPSRDVYIHNDESGS